MGVRDLASRMSLHVRRRTKNLAHIKAQQFQFVVLQESLKNVNSRGFKRVQLTFSSINVQRLREVIFSMEKL